MARHKKHQPKVKKTLDVVSVGRGRGRPWKVVPSWVLGRAENYRKSLAEIWPKLRGSLLAAETEQQVIAAFETFGQPCAREFVPRLASDILAVVHGPGFPKRPKAQINFLGDSLGGRPNVTPRTSRDICARERAKEKRAQHIIRYEFYVECSCGYKGPARDNACRKCGARIVPSLGGLFASRFF